MVAVCSAGEDWQALEKGSPQASLYQILCKSPGPIRTDNVTGFERNELKKAVSELEAKLLIIAKQIHTDSGKHVRVIQTMTNWARESAVETSPSIGSAKRRLEDIVASVASSATTKKRTLPWL